MRKITFSADEDLIEKAHAIARARHTTLNEAFRDWLIQFTASTGDAQSFDSLMQQLHHIKSRGPYTREQMNDGKKMGVQ